MTLLFTFRNLERKGQFEKTKRKKKKRVRLLLYTSSLRKLFGQIFNK